MSWFAWLILGLLIGWLVEWLIDLFYWRGSCKQRDAELSRRENDVEARLRKLAEDEKAMLARQSEWDVRHRGLLDALTQREASFANRESELKTQQGQLTTRLSEIDTRHKLLAERDDSMTQRLTQATALSAALGGREQDLSRQWAELEARSAAVGKRAEELAARETVLQRQLQEIDSRTAQANAALARLQAADGELAVLRSRSAKLGDIVRQRYQTRTGADDIEVVEGIGPKIAELLHNDGIHSFRELSMVSVDRFNRVLEAGGPRFKLANPGTWAEQARLLAEGEYVAFEKLKDELTAGVRLSSDGEAS